MKGIIVFFYFISLFEANSSTVIFNFVGNERLREIRVFAPLGNFANSFVPTIYTFKGNTFKINIENEVKIGVQFYIPELDLGLPIYLEIGEILEVFVKENSSEVEFLGHFGKNHERFYIKYNQYKLSSKLDKYNCPDKYLKNEYMKCIDSYLSFQIDEMKKDSICTYYMNHFVLDFILKVQIELKTDKKTSNFINELLIKYITNESILPQLLGNYFYYYFKSKYNDKMEKSFNSKDLQSYNYFLNIEDDEIVSYMIQIQLAALYNMKFPFENFCESYNEVRKISKNFVKLDFYSEHIECNY